MSTLVSRQQARPVHDLTPEQDQKMKDSMEEKKFLSEKEIRSSVLAIRQTIKNEEIRLRKKYNWLNRQDLLGFLTFIFSIIALVVTALFYLKKKIHWSLVIPLMALPGSIMHELEHDLIHNLYFKSKQWVQHLMFVVIHFTKWSLPPWYRKMIHIRHHQESGTEKDIEERLIGLGKPLDFMRWAITLYPFANTLVLDELQEDNPKDWSKHKLVLSALPTVVPFTVLWHLFVGYSRLMMGLTFGSYDPVHYLPEWGWPIVRDLSVLILLPNVLRQASLNLMASYSHYYGDIPHNSVFYQNQIIDHWLMYPLQLFCFNFGATHIIHHFVPNQPFYLRQMLAPKSLAAMIKRGIRYNDWGIIKRNNRFFDETGSVTKRRQNLDLSIEAPKPELTEPASSGGDNSADSATKEASIPSELKQD